MLQLATLILVATVLVTTAAQGPTNGVSLTPAVQKAFTQAFPTATISGATEQRDGNRTLLRVDSIDKGRRRVVLYDPNGTVVETAEQVEEKDLPQAVAAAMHSHPRAIYVNGMKVTRGREVEYHLTVRGTRKTAMIAKTDGTVVSFR